MENQYNSTLKNSTCRDEFNLKSNHFNDSSDFDSAKPMIISDFDKTNKMFQIKQIEKLQ